MSDQRQTQFQATAFMFSTYPFKVPKHGGQLRSSQLLAQYQKVFRKVVPIAVFDSSVYRRNEWGTYDLPSSMVTSKRINKRPKLEPWILGESLISDTKNRSALLRLLKKFKPDVLIFEQPYLFNSVMQLCQELGLTPKVINSTQNDETAMMRDILESGGNTDREVQEFSTRLRELENTENYLALNAQGSIAVSTKDLATLEARGSQNSLVAPNGIAEKSSTWYTRTALQRLKRDLNINEYALFVGSAHAPNVSGFIEILGTRMGYLPEGSKIILAGGVGHALRLALQRMDEPYESIFWHRVLDVGVVSKAALAALIELSNCVILPITSGGGSNLKTAEAILSRRPIVATAHAFRGFERYSTLPNVKVVDQPSTFQAELTTLLDNPSQESDYSNEASRREVLWEHSLSPLTTWLENTLAVAENE